MILRGVFLLVVVWLTASASLGYAQDGAGAGDAPARPLVRVVTTDFVLPAKFAQMAQWARDEGYELDWRVAMPGRPGAVGEGADFLILDGPRPSDMARVQDAVGEPDQIATPWIRIGGGPPGFGRLPPATARRLIGYYAGGTRTNLRPFVTAVGRVLADQPLDDLPAPVRLPEAGFYHPAAQAFFTSPESYLDWLSTHAPGRPVVALAMAPSNLRDMQTDVLDALVHALEDAGLAPALVWFDDADPQGLSRMIAPLAPQALVNLTHMQNGEARKAEFARLDIPVLQTVGARTGTIAEWRRDPSGVPAYAAAVMLSVPESWGMSDPLVVSAIEDGKPVPMADQIGLLARKLARLIDLRRKSPADKSLAVFFWNHPHGEKNLSASNLNVPRSLEKLTRDLGDAGYTVTPEDEATLIAQAQAMLAGYYRPETLDTLQERGLAARLPVADYRAWLDSLPTVRRREILTAGGDPDLHWAVRGDDFVIPRLQLGNLSILPQPPRGGDPKQSYHNLDAVPDHVYLAAYLWVREKARADAIIHFGTHGTQEWTPGKDRGLWAGDYPFLLLGDIPVFYPYIQDNVAEAIQARRRGRAVTISHQTPAFAPSGLYDELRDIHALIHEYSQLDSGGVKGRLANGIRDRALATHMAADIGWDRAAIDEDFSGFFNALHDHLHQLARTSIPLGLHVFGSPAAREHRLTTVLQQLGPDYLAALGLDPKEAFAEDFAAIRESLPYRTLETYLVEKEPTSSIDDPTLRAQIERARELEANLAETGETKALLRGLAGGFVEAGTGGDPVRNPKVRSGRNLYAFDADKVPARAAYAEGGTALDGLLVRYREKHDGALPEKLAFSLFSGETIRTLGINEGQILHALGLRPVYGRGDKVTALEIVPVTEMDHPRIDIVVQATSVYRDQFDGFMKMLAGAINRLAARDEPGLAAHVRASEQALIERGIAPDRAHTLASLRIFSNAPGDYGSGLPDQIAKDAEWSDEAELAAPFLERLQYAYGAREWGFRTEEVNLFAEQLRDVDAAVMSRSSNVHGLLSTDHPFEYLGGLSLAVRSLSGKAPDVFVTDLRTAGEPRVATAGEFISTELRARYLNPQWIGEMQAQGYAGANAMLDIVNNVYGWQVTDPASIRADQWEAMLDTYVRDTRDLGLGEFFARVHPEAQAQIIERMGEAIRRGYWDADSRTRTELAERLAGIRARAGDAEVRKVAGGYGRARMARAARMARKPETATAAPQASQPAPRPRGRVLKKEELAPSPPPDVQGMAWAALVILLLIGLGGAAQWRAHCKVHIRKTAHARA